MLESKNQNFLKAGGVGVSAAFFYSLTPLFVFFFASSTMKITYAIFLATIQELMSFLLVSLVVGFTNWKTNLVPKNKWLNYTIFIPLFQIVGFGITQSLFNLLKKLKNPRVWIMSGVGLIAGPISMALLMISALYLNDGTLGNVILNTAPIYCMLLSRLILKNKINHVALIGIITTSLLTFGMLFNYFFLQETINWKLIVGVVISFVAALAYASEGLVSDYFLHHQKIQLSNYEVVMVKSFVSFWLMLIVALPLGSIVDNQPFTTGWTIFQTSFLDYGWFAILIYLSGVVMGVGRLMYFQAVKFSHGTYALSTQLTMLIWTPVLQITGNALIQQIATEELAWYYWLWTGLILISLLIVTFNEEITDWIKKKKLLKKNLDLEEVTS